MRRGVTAVVPWPIVGGGSSWVWHGVSVVLLGLVLASRLLFLPDGPWEQDEALIACGVVDFDPSSHMPLPPGFPLWILIGRFLVLLGVGDPLVALQVASALFSVVAFWATIGVFERFTGRGVAVSGAMLAAFLPGVWFHAARGFSGTAAAALALLGLAAWVRLGEHGFATGVAFLTAAALVRPPLAPWFLLVVLLASWGVRRKSRRLLIAALVATAILAAVLLPMVAEAGGWGLFLSSGAVHAAEHFGLAGTEDSMFAHLGYTVGAGGVTAAALLGFGAIVGWATLRRQLAWRWWAGTVAAAWLVFLLVVLHNRTYPRYWILVWLVAAPLAVHGVARLCRSRLAATLLASVAAVVAARAALPAVMWIHQHPLPAYGALRVVANEGRGVLIFDDGLFSFRNLAARQGWLRVASMRTSEIPPRRLSVGGDTIWFLTDGPGLDAPATVSSAFDWVCDNPQAVALSQDRFLTARLVRDPVLVWRGGSIPEYEESRRFVWCSSATQLLLPPLSGAGTVTLGIEIHHLLGTVEVRALVDGTETLRTRAAGSSLLSIPIPPLQKRNALKQVVPIDITVAGEVELPGDRRPLALRIFACSVEAPPYAPAPYAVFPEPRTLLAAAMTGSGVFGPELMGEPRRAAAWLGPEGRFDMPMGAGQIVLDLLAPRPGPVPVTVSLGSASAAFLVPAGNVRVALPVPKDLAQRRRGEVRITSEAFIPGPGDPRQLGVALSRIAFVPDPIQSSF